MCSFEERGAAAAGFTSDLLVFFSNDRSSTFLGNLRTGFIWLQIAARIVCTGTVKVRYGISLPFVISVFYVCEECPPYSVDAPQRCRLRAAWPSSFLVSRPSYT